MSKQEISDEDYEEIISSLSHQADLARSVSNTGQVKHYSDIIRRLQANRRPATKKARLIEDKVED